MFVASLAHAAWSNYEEVRELSLDAGALRALQVEAGAGDLQIVGVSGSNRITVRATIEVPDANDNQAKKIIESDLVLSLERSGDQGVLKSKFNPTLRIFKDSPRIHLEVHIPSSLALIIEDGSGALSVSSVHADIDIDDGSGSITLSEVGGRVNIDDGSGSIEVSAVQGDLSIVDGSGGITAHGVRGSVFIDDGSGALDISDVTGDLVIEDDGSGSQRFSGIQGKVANDG
jgi:hypothetical protein